MRVGPLGVWVPNSLRVPRRGSGMSTETPTTSASRPASQGQGDVAVVEGKLNYLRLT